MNPLCNPAKMPRVYQKHGSWYWVMPVTNKWVRLCKIDEGAEQLQARLTEQKRRAGHDDLSGMGNTPALVTRYIDESVGEHKEKAWPSYGRYVRQGFADIDVEAIDMAYVTEFLSSNWFGKLAMQRVMRAFLSGFFRWCMQKRLMQTNPCSELRLKKPKPRKTYISDMHFAAIRAAMVATAYQRGDELVTATVPTGPMMQCFVDLCYLTFQRSTDIRLLTWGQVDFSAGVIHFEPTKTADSSGVSVNIAITPEIATVLERVRELGGAAIRTEKMPVIHQKNGKPYGVTGLRSAWDRACDRAGLKGESYTVKDIRAKALTDAHRIGHGTDVLKIAAAHADERTTRIYLKQRVTPVSSIRMALPSV